jgi:ATP synthase protein I
VGQIVKTPGPRDDRPVGQDRTAAAMTTARQPRQPGSNPGVAGRVVRRALLATLVLGALLAAVGGAVSGTPALVGVLVGTALVCGFFGLGTVVLTWVTKVSPAASLLVGLMTYTLQVVVLGLAFAVLQASGLMGSTIDGTWLGCTVIAGTFLWLAIQVTVSLRTRQLYYDLPAADAPDGGSGPASEGRSGSGPGAMEAGAR